MTTPRKLTLRNAQEIASRHGWTLRKSDSEFQCYPKGQGPDAPAAVFESDLESALSSALYNLPSSHADMLRIEESQIAAFQAERISEIKARPRKDSRCVGFVAAADLECNAARHCATQGRQLSSASHMRRAAWHYAHAAELLRLAARNEKGAYWKAAQLEQAHRVELQSNVSETYAVEFGI